MKNKVEDQPRKVNKQNSVVKPIRDVDVKHSLLNANSKPICATCKKSMFDGVHDMCLLDFVENVNTHAKSAKKHKKQNIWKPTESLAVGEDDELVTEKVLDSSMVRIQDICSEDFQEEVKVNTVGTWLVLPMPSLYCQCEFLLLKFIFLIVLNGGSFEEIEGLD
ncbi:hypothetical protein Tco_1033431 [Tanacetum coccineum]